MPTLQLPDAESLQEIISDRQRSGRDRQDEVWDGEYVIMPDPNYEHQELAGEIQFAIRSVVPKSGGDVLPGLNVTDRAEGWRENYRCPDIAVYLTDNPAGRIKAGRVGGPDLAVEIVSPGDRSRQKVGFYGDVRTRELLLVERDPWLLEVFRLDGGELRSAGVAYVDDEPVRTRSVPLSWRLEAGAERPAVVVSADDGREWRL